MLSRQFNLGDIVAIKTHPFVTDSNKIIISGDHIMLPPLMVITEILKTKQLITVGLDTSNAMKYKCIWFSSKAHKFIDAWLYESDIKLYQKSLSNISLHVLSRGEKVILKTVDSESEKLKSSLSYDDNVSSNNNFNTIFNPLLSFLPPVMQVIEVTAHKSKHPIAEKKTGEIIRLVSNWDVKCMHFDPTTNKLSEITLPLESLNSIASISEIDLSVVTDAVNNDMYLLIQFDTSKLLIKPRHITSRNGRYYLRAYDYVLNKVIEISINDKFNPIVLKQPYMEQAPKFDIAKKPMSASPESIIREIIATITKAEKVNSYIRIKYKNRNEKLSYRTLKNYKIIYGITGAKSEPYLIGFCSMRNSTRTFKIERIQNVQQLVIAAK